METTAETTAETFDRHRNERGYDIAVVGAGIAGLVAAVSAIEAGSRVVLIDAHDPGGRARTTVRDGFEYNIGPHALFLAGHLQSFLAARSMAPTGGLPLNRRVELLRDGRLWPLSLGAVDIARTKLLTPRGRVRILGLMARLPRMSTEQFVGTTWQSWLGNEADDVAGILRMFVRTATYTNAEPRFDAGAALDQFKLALRGVRYVDHGWQTIVDSLLSRFTSLGGDVVRRTVLSVSSQGATIVETSQGRVEARATVLAGLSPDAVERLTGSLLHGQAAQGGAVLASALDLALCRPHERIVFGIDESLYITPHAPLAQLAPVGSGLVSALRYTPDGEQSNGGSIPSVRGRLDDLVTMTGIDDADILHERYLHRLVVANSFPSAAAGGLRGRPSVDALEMAGVFLAGDWVGPAGQLADASAASGESAARGARAHLAKSSNVRV